VGRHGTTQPYLTEEREVAVVLVPLYWRSGEVERYVGWREVGIKILQPEDLRARKGVGQLADLIDTNPSHRWKSFRSHLLFSAATYQHNSQSSFAHARAPSGGSSSNRSRLSVACTSSNGSK
jgi:hypothetical protein